MSHSYQLWDIRFLIRHFLHRKSVILVLSVRWSQLLKWCLVVGIFLSNRAAVYLEIQEFLLSIIYQLKVAALNIFLKIKAIWFLQPIVYGGSCFSCFSCYTQLNEQILLLDCLYFLRYWSICVLQLFLNQLVT